MRVVGVDWSGRRVGERRHLWTAETGPLGSDGPAGALVGRSRHEAAGYLLALADADANLVAGLDFGFSLPAWFLHDQRIESVAELWDDGDRLERWLAACEPPFWGRPGRPCPPAGADGTAGRWRATELAAAAVGPRPKSVFQVGGAGAVGTGSLRGMPVLARLRRAGFSVWPFDPPRPPVVLEVWPRHHYGGPLVKSSATARAAAAERLLPELWRAVAAASEDAFDAAVTAVGLAASLSEILAAPSPTHPLAPLEGWIWGVPDPTTTAELVAGSPGIRG